MVRRQGEKLINKICGAILSGKGMAGGVDLPEVLTIGFKVFGTGKL